MVTVSRGNAVGIATGYGLDGRGVGAESRQWQDFSPLHSVRTGSGTHPVSYQMGNGGSFCGDKAAGP
jgi:hypothetical protein